MKKLCIYLIGLALITGLLAFPAIAQDDVTSPDDWGPVPTTTIADDMDESENLVTLDFRDADVGDVLRTLFKDSGASYALPPEVKGRVTVSLNDVQFSVALRTILDQVKATFRREGNVYSILLAADVPADDVGSSAFRTPQRLRVIEVRFSDAAELAYLFGGTGSGAYGVYPEFESFDYGGTGSGGNRGTGNNRNNNNNNINNNRNTNTSNTNRNSTNTTGGGFGSGMGGGGFGGFSFR